MSDGGPLYRGCWTPGLYAKPPHPQPSALCGCHIPICTLAEYLGVKADGERLTDAAYRLLCWAEATENGGRYWPFITADEARAIAEACGVRVVIPRCPPAPRSRSE